MTTFCREAPKAGGGSHISKPGFARGGYCNTITTNSGVPYVEDTGNRYVGIGRHIHSTVHTI